MVYSVCAGLQCKCSINVCTYLCVFALQVRGLWKGVESFLERSKGEKEVVTAIIDRTLEKYTLDAANIQISIPHLMLLECEQEIRRVGFSGDKCGSFLFHLFHFVSVRCVCAHACECSVPHMHSTWICVL